MVDRKSISRHRRLQIPERVQRVTVGAHMSTVTELEEVFRRNVIEGANALPDLVSFLSSTDDETAFKALKSVMRCVREALGASALYRVGCTANEKYRKVFAGTLDESQIAAALTMMAWAHTQLTRIAESILLLVEHEEGGVSIPAIQALGELIALEFQGLAYHSLPCELPAAWIEQV